MGIDICAAKFLDSEARRGLRFGHTLTLGHQSLYLDRNQYGSILKSLGISYSGTPYADELFRGLGATEIDIMDASNYEGANVLHNLSEPVNVELHEKFDFIFDGGTLEHVFNFPVALKNCMEMVRVGGHFITITPASGLCGHGFYQFSPELFYSALSPQNGYEVERLLFVYRNQWYSVKKPEAIRERVELITSEPTKLFVSAKKLEKKKIFSDWPQQSDYRLAWDAGKSTVPPVEAASFLKKWILGASPQLRNLQNRWRAFKHKRRCQPSNRSWFTLIELD
jgi:SAM-dependent methyltransferase